MDRDSLSFDPYLGRLCRVDNVSNRFDQSITIPSIAVVAIQATIECGNGVCY